MPPVDDYSADIISRVREILDPTSKWSRRIWDLGLVMSLKELDEAAAGVSKNALSASALKRQAQSTQSTLRSDPGSGTEQEVQGLSDVLKTSLTHGGFSHGELRYWSESIERTYLSRWAAACATSEKPGRERAARALASHLLDLGFSPYYLIQWLKTTSATPITASDLFDSASTLAAAGPSQFEIGVDLTEAALFEPGASFYLTPKQMGAWHRANNHDQTIQAGGLVVKVSARDEHAATALAIESFDRLCARARVGASRPLRLADRLYVAGRPDSVSSDRSRGAEIRALLREGHILAPPENTKLDAALELASNLNEGSPAVAVAAGWSAIETLLTSPGDDGKAVAADRLADLVACSWPRAELTTIASRRIRQQSAKQRDQLANDLQSCSTNRERCELALSEIVASRDLKMRWRADRMSEQRMKQLADQSHRELRNVRERAARIFRRMYSQRNLVVHGGQVDSDVLRSVLRVASPLIGAGMDRVVHAHLVDGKTEIEIATRAHFELSRVGSPGAPSLTQLLE